MAVQGKRRVADEASVLLSAAIGARPLVKWSIASALTVSIVYAAFEKFYLQKPSDLLFWLREVVIVPGCAIATFAGFSLRH